MWRTSWLSREVIVLPAFIGLVALWWLALRDAARRRSSRSGCCRSPRSSSRWSLWYCTAMIYACLRFIEEWAQPLTLVNFVLLGLASGFVLASALAAFAGERAFLAASGPAALLVDAGRAGRRAWRRCAATPRIRHRSTLQSATGIRAARLVQTSMGMSAGSFNTREFFHRASLLAMRRIRLAVIALAFAGRSRSWLFAWATASAPLWIVAALLQAPGLLADRWYFFAQAKHPQNLYYQVVS